ncbi:MAG: hypothetical protein WBQ63_02925 [Candidatus Acidiferrales bacterium]
MRTNQLQKYAVICGLLALAISFAQPLRAQQLSSSSISLATAAADAVPAAVTMNVAAHPVQNYESMPVTDLPDAASTSRPIDRIGVERLPSRRAWLALSIGEHSAAFFDAYSTRRAIATGATEQNPMLRPFASSPAIYAATQVWPLVMDYAARRMQVSSHDFVRRMWWIPQSSSMAVSIFAGVHNTSVADRP